ncbi:IS4 family transposase [Thomasclavelia sp.]|uniref:IS4 family transposase n=1 Tax=Thomasclavelia sp. TaxID=3025757 RepID=UPI0025D781EB|nr:IS4 family transposase [Thomasclavelia sp.]
MSIYSTFEYFDTLLSHPDIFEIARKDSRYFTRDSKLGLPGLLKFLISRQGYTVANEINHYYSSFDLEKSVSKQAIFQAQEKLDYKVFPYINSRLCKYYYQNNDYETFKGYTVVAIDGSIGEAPYTKKNRKVFGAATYNEDCALTKTNPRISGFYDVCNGIYLDVSIKSYTDSEIPMAYEQMNTVHDVLENHKVIFMADRYYPSTDMFIYYNMNNDKFCYRGKSNFYKKYVKDIERDGWIEFDLDDKWINRFKIEEVRDYAREHKKFGLRVIKIMKSELRKLKDDEKDEQMLLFTNLDDNEWSTKEVILLYGNRWSIETGYDTLKNKLEMERVTSEKADLILQELHSQVIVYNLAAMIKKESDKIITHTEKYKYQTNINNLIQLLRANFARLLNIKEEFDTLIRKIIEKASKNKEPIRTHRLFDRWDVYINKPPTLKFRVDGKRNPKFIKTKKGFLRSNR